MPHPEPDTATECVPGEVEYAFRVLGFLSLVVVFQAVRRILSDGVAADVEAGITAGGWPVTVSAVLMTGVVLLGVWAGLQVLFVFKMRSGRNWARFVLTVFSALAVAGSAVGVADIGNAPVAGIVNVLMALATIAAVVFMFVPASNAYFRTAR